MTSSLLDGRVYRWFHECEADCPAMAQELIPIHGRGFQFCDHHATRVADQLVELGHTMKMPSAAGPTLTEVA